MTTNYLTNLYRLDRPVRVAARDDENVFIRWTLAVNLTLKGVMWI